MVKKETLVLPVHKVKLVLCGLRGLKETQDWYMLKAIYYNENDRNCPPSSNIFRLILLNPHSVEPKFPSGLVPTPDSTYSDVFVNVYEVK